MVTMAMIMISAAPTPDGLSSPNPPSSPSSQKQGVFKFITNKVVMDSVVHGLQSPCSGFPLHPRREEVTAHRTHKTYRAYNL